MIAFDIETIANKNLIDLLPEPTIDSRLKDPQKIESALAEAKEKQLNEMGLNPHFNKVCCFSWCDLKGQTGSIVLEDENPQTYGVYIAKIWQTIAGYNRFVTFNGINFDVPILEFHAMRYSYRVPIRIEKNRYKVTGQSNHIDMRCFFSQDQYAKGGLDFFARIYLGSKKTDGIEGSSIQSFWDLGLTAEISKYCEQDCRLTMDLYKCAQGVGLI